MRYTFENRLIEIKRNEIQTINGHGYPKIKQQ